MRSARGNWYISKKSRKFSDSYLTKSSSLVFIRIISAVICSFCVFSIQNLATAKTLPNDSLVSTPWRDTDGGRVRIAIEPNWNNGQRQGLIEVELQPGWKTYWQNPGNSGMAPSFTFKEPLNYHIFYPVPHLFADGEDWSFGYKNNVILPFSLTSPTNTPDLSGHLTIGFCEKICLPVDVDFNFESSVLQVEQIKASYLETAKQQLPEPANNNIQINAEPKNNQLSITIATPKNVKISALYLDGGDNELGPAKIIDQKDGQTTFSADILYMSSDDKFSVNYIADAAPKAFTGTFTVTKR